ncbi:WXG100 family type VII secretion target [Ornithinimicrobium flavum]|uniref:WXG100 family type VII secretion target n=1 Tax=Ornithinimicrobium flavum TaxID=1288636 RepID=UPI00106FBE8C|nr:WXG100 family type VII secretion target [Ornithinimicrobium flavum]
MGYAVGVDGDQVDAAAARLAEVARELSAAGEALAGALRSVADATAAGALASAATGAAPRWRGGMGAVAEHGAGLARATSAAADAYRAVERRCTQGWAGPGGGGTRWGR